MTTVSPTPESVSTSISKTSVALFLAEVTVTFPTEPQQGHRLIEALRNALRHIEDAYTDIEVERAHDLDRAAARAVNAQSAQLSVAPVIPVQRIAVTQDTPQDAA